MPTYTYRCTKCGEDYEVFQSMSDPPLKRCRKCRGALRRTFHPVGIVLKGSGFHRNDYRTKRPPSEGAKKSDDAQKTDTKSETKTDGKNESKSESKSESSTESRSSDKKGSSSD